MTTSALHAGGLCDITTVGRRSGDPHRIEIAFHHLDGEYFITGRPGGIRDWLANMRVDPEFTLHLREGTDITDVTARAEEITDPEERERVLYAIRTRSWGVDPEEVAATNAAWVEASPLIRFTVKDD